MAAVVYSKLYELIKNVKDEREAEEICKIIEEYFAKKCKEEVSKNFEEQKPVFKAELKDELKDELATKKDIALLEERMNSMEERILRYVDDKFHYLDKKIDESFYKLDKKMTIGFIILILLYILTNPNAIELIRLLFGIK
jgi:uncharacterized membrane protein YheB (UPF0754 family)